MRLAHPLSLSSQSLRPSHSRAHHLFFQHTLRSALFFPFCFVPPIILFIHFLRVAPVFPLFPRPTSPIGCLPPTSIRSTHASTATPAHQATAYSLTPISQDHFPSPRPRQRYCLHTLLTPRLIAGAAPRPPFLTSSSPQRPASSTTAHPRRSFGCTLHQPMCNTLTATLYPHLRW
ncbi:hypothetical protein K469DRAFT_327994 [Zopfia rhizophila CBS 207.26]|uniref:Uncharacterized protein n=1 Tax=Zopfia rhizophila CBS 207.26 TaxID=1314779 RepID=A0A6A6DHU8_9PEZI|nr:hypothetical protein K469DRAFT_327994 [Zopfia rhizophila CBS 207.26]